MPYATQADLSPSVIPLKTLMELTDDSRSGKIDTDVVAGKLAKASGVIEMYCRERYKLPLQPTQELVDLCTTLAARELYGRNGRQVPESIGAAADEALKRLRDISSGKASLDQPTGPTDQASSGTIAISKRRRVFSGGNLDGYV